MKPNVEVRINLPDISKLPATVNLDTYISRLNQFYVDLEDELEKKKRPGVEISVSRKEDEATFDRGKGAVLLFGAVVVGVAIGITAIVNPGEARAMLEIIIEGLQRCFAKNNVSISVEMDGKKLAVAARSSKELREIISPTAAILDKAFADRNKSRLLELNVKSGD